MSFYAPLTRNSGKTMSDCQSALRFIFYFFFKFIEQKFLKYHTTSLPNLTISLPSIFFLMVSNPGDLYITVIFKILKNMKNLILFHIIFDICGSNNDFLI